MEGAYLPTYPQTPFPQCSSVLEGQTNSRPSDIPPLPQNLQVCGEAAGNQVFPFIRPPDSMYQMTFPCFTPSTLKSEVFQVAEDEDTTLVYANATRDPCEGHMSMNIFPDQSRHQHAPVETAVTTHNFSASSSLPTSSHTPIPVQSQQQSASRDELRRFQTSTRRKGHAATTSRSYRRRTGASKRPYLCNICGKAYAQPQGVTRHHREAHQVSVCSHCGNFRWGRPYQLRKHLKEQHPNIDPDSVLGGPIGSRRKVTQISKCSPQQQVSTQRSCDEPRLCPQASHSPDVADATFFSPTPVMSPLDYLQPKPVEPMCTTRAHEDPRDLSLDVNYTCAAVSSTDDFVPQANDWENAFQSERIWYRNEGKSACVDESATANSQSKLYHISYPYRLLADMVATQPLWSLLSNRLDPCVLHSPVQNMIDLAPLARDTGSISVP